MIVQTLYAVKTKLMLLSLQGVETLTIPYIVGLKLRVSRHVYKLGNYHSGTTQHFVVL